MRHTKAAISKPRYITKRIYKNFDPALFIQAVQDISWWELHSCDSVDAAVEIFSNNMTTILDVMAPIKTIQVRSNFAPWISENTKEKINERDAAKKRFDDTKNDEDWKTFKRHRNSVTNTLRTEKKMWQKRKLSECSGDPKETWKNVKYLG